MHHEAASGGIELVTGLSYLMILLGFALRQYLESSTTRLLWPWMLVSIFGLCGLTRLDYVGVIAAPELLVTSFHLLLATIALAYGVGQLLYAFWPELSRLTLPCRNWRGGTWKRMFLPRQRIQTADMNPKWLHLK